MICLALALWLWSLLSARVTAIGFDTGAFLLGLAFFLAMLLVGMFLYMAWCAFTIAYTLDRNRLSIRCGGVRHVVPLANVAAVYPPYQAVNNRPATVRWKGATGFVPGYVVGEGESRQLGRVVSVATVPVAGQVFVVTPGVTFGVSPQNAAGFVDQIKKRQEAAEDAGEDAVRTELRGPSTWAAALWADRPARVLLVLALVLNVAFFGYLSLVYQNLPFHLPLHWNSQAQIDRIGDPSELLRLPVFGLLVWLVNAIIGWWALPRERAVTLFLLAGAVAAQVAFAAGAVSIVLRT